MFLFLLTIPLTSFSKDNDQIIEKCGQYVGYGKIVCDGEACKLVLNAGKLSKIEVILKSDKHSFTYLSGMDVKIDIVVTKIDENLNEATVLNYPTRQSSIVVNSYLKLKKSLKCEQ